MSLEHRQYLQRAKNSSGGLPRRSGGLPFQPKFKNTFDLGVKASAFSNTPPLPHEIEKQKEELAEVKEIQKPLTHKEQGLPQKEGLKNDGGLPEKGGMKKAVADIKILPKGGLKQDGGLIHTQKGKKHRKQVMNNVEFFEERDLLGEATRLDIEGKSIYDIKLRNAEIQKQKDAGEEVKDSIVDISERKKIHKEKKDKFNQDTQAIGERIDNGTATSKDIQKMSHFLALKNNTTLASEKSKLTEKNEKGKKKNTTKQSKKNKTNKSPSSSVQSSALASTKSPISSISSETNDYSNYFEDADTFIPDIDIDEKSDKKTTKETRTQKGKKNAPDLVRLLNLQNINEMEQFLNNRSIDELKGMAGIMNIKLGSKKRDKESYINAVMTNMEIERFSQSNENKSKKKSQVSDTLQGLE